MSRAARSISTPIILAAMAVALSIALLVGWTLLIVQNLPVGANAWLLVLGVLSFVVIMGVLTIFGVVLVREIQEGRRQTRFVDSVTHELKSPLSSLRLCLETLRRPELSGEQRAEVLSMMAVDTDRLSTFIDDVLQAGRLTDGQPGIVLSDVALREVCEDSVRAVKRRHHLSEGVSLDVPEDLRLYSDRAALETVIRNLVDNAVKYSDGSVEVSVHARQQHNVVEITVNDRGIGLPKAELRRIFKRFYRVESEHTRRRPGTGLGLFVVEALVRYLGGRLEARSPGPGQGTTLRVVLPLRAPKAAATGWPKGRAQRDKA